MTKRDIVLRIAEVVDVRQQDIARILQKALECIVEALQRGESVEFRNFGVFCIREHKPRVGRNPKKPEQTVVIPQRKVVKFKPGRILRRTITVR